MPEEALKVSNASTDYQSICEGLAYLIRVKHAFSQCLPIPYLTWLHSHVTCFLNVHKKHLHHYRTCPCLYLYLCSNEDSPTQFHLLCLQHEKYTSQLQLGLKALEARRKEKPQPQKHKDTSNGKPLDRVERKAYSATGTCSGVWEGIRSDPFCTTLRSCYMSRGVHVCSFASQSRKRKSFFVAVFRMSRLEDVQIREALVLLITSFPWGR